MKTIPKDYISPINHEIYQVGPASWESLYKRDVFIGGGGTSDRYKEVSVLLKGWPWCKRALDGI